MALLHDAGVDRCGGTGSGMPDTSNKRQQATKTSDTNVGRIHPFHTQLEFTPKTLWAIVDASFGSGMDKGTFGRQWSQ